MGGSDELFNSPTCRLSTKGATHAVCSGNGTSSTIRSVCKLDVEAQEKPEGFNKVLRDSMCFIGDEMELPVVINDSEATCLWTFNGEQISESDENYEFRSDNNRRVLVIKRASVDNKGAFACNVSGNKCECVLDVQEHITVVTHLEKAKVTEGEDYL